MGQLPHSSASSFQKKSILDVVRKYKCLPDRSHSFLKDNYVIFIRPYSSRLMTTLCIWGMFNHESLLLLEDYIFYEDKICYALPYKRCTLSDFLFYQPSACFSESFFRQLWLQIAKALEYLNKQQFVYAVLRLETIYVDHTPPHQCYLGDFSGLRKVNESFGEFDEQDPAKLIYDGKHYKGPESPFHTKQHADVWSLGVLMFLMMADCNPIKGSTVDELSAHIVLGKIEWDCFRDSFSTSINLLKSLLIVDPDSRLTIDRVVNLLM